MSYYKRDGNQLLRSDAVFLPDGRALVPETSATYTYPVDGWWWVADDDPEKVEERVGLDTRQDITLIIKNAAGTRLFGLRFDRRGIFLANLSNQTAKIDASGGTQSVSDYSLAANTWKYVKLDRIYPEPGD